MTIDDVVFSLQRMFHPHYARYFSRSDEYFENPYRVEKVGEQTLRVYSKKDEPLMQLLLNVQQSMIVPMKYIMGVTGHPEIDEASDYDAFGLAPVGTGPYKVTTFKPGEETVYERFNDYWGEKAPFEKIHYRRIKELSTRITALVNDEVDLITGIPPDQLAAINNKPNYKTVGMVGVIFHVVIFNTSNPLLRIRIGRILFCDFFP
jgi:peptide/nickel transport system substrate-binding protein